MYSTPVRTETFLKWRTAFWRLVTNSALMLHSKLQWSHEKAGGSSQQKPEHTNKHTHTDTDMQRWLTSLWWKQGEAYHLSWPEHHCCWPCKQLWCSTLCHLTSTFVQINLWRVVLDRDCKNTLETDISNIAGPYVWQTTEVTWHWRSPFSVQIIKCFPSNQMRRPTCCLRT